MSQIQAFKYIVSSITSMSAKHSAAVLVLTIHLIFVDDQEKNAILLLFCKNICPPALDTSSHKLAYAASVYTTMVGFEIDEKMRINQSAFVYYNFFSNLIALSKSKIVEFLFIEILQPRTSKQMSGCVCVATQFI